MADNRMKDDDLKRDMGAGREGGEGQDYGKQTPGRNPQGGQHTGQPGQQGGKEPINLDDDELDRGSAGQRGGQNR